MLSSNQTRQRGFTLIELVVVIVIIGILAAFAIPRFSNIARDARVSSANALLGSIRSTAALVHGLALARNTPNGADIDLEGSPVRIQFAYPAGSAIGISNALSSISGYTPDGAAPAGTVTLQVTGASILTTCYVRYVEPTAAGLAPTISSDTTGC